MGEVDLLLDWAAPMMEHHEVLLKMALFEKTYHLRWNVESGHWEPVNDDVTNVPDGDRSPEEDIQEDSAH